MSNTTTLVSFNGVELITTQLQDVTYVAMRPIVEAMGLSWSSQLKRIREGQLKQWCVDIATPTKTGIQEMLFIPLKKLNGWLFSINPEKVRSDLKDIVIKYQEDCFEVLHDYWNNGQAVNPRFRKEETRKALPSGLSKDQQDAVKAFHKELVQSVPPANQASLAITLWSAIKTKYGVGYKEVPSENFTNVISLMSRIAVEKGVLYGEVLEPIQTNKLLITDEEVYEIAVAVRNIQRMALLLEHFLPALRCLDSQFIGRCEGYSSEFFERTKQLSKIVNRLYPHVEPSFQHFIYKNSMNLL